MNKFINTINITIFSFQKDETGSQVIEYALIIAVVSIGLVVALGAATGGLQSSFEALVTRVSNCFSGPTCT